MNSAEVFEQTLGQKELSPSTLPVPSTLSSTSTQEHALRYLQFLSNIILTKPTVNFNRLMTSIFINKTYFTTKIFYLSM